VEPREQHISVRRTARYFLLGPPPEQTTQVWFVLHGYGQLAERFARRFHPLASAGALVVAPEALSRYYLDGQRQHGPDSAVGASWMTREDRSSEIADYLAYLDRLRMQLLDEPYRLGTTVSVLGFSQGCATAARWAALGVARPKRLILWAGTLPPDLDLHTAHERLSRARLTYVIGRQDEHLNEEAIQREEERLAEAGIPCEIVWHDGGHRVEEDVLRRLAFD
jgi:predicted esterase